MCQCPRLEYRSFIRLHFVHTSKIIGTFYHFPFVITVHYTLVHGRDLRSDFEFLAARFESFSSPFRPTTTKKTQPQWMIQRCKMVKAKHTNKNPFFSFVMTDFEICQTTNQTTFSNVNKYKLCTIIWKYKTKNTAHRKKKMTQRNINNNLRRERERERDETKRKKKKQEWSTQNTCKRNVNWLTIMLRLW